MGYKFNESEQDHRLSELEDIATSHERRAEIGSQLALIGDTRLGVGLTSTGVPEIEWCYVEAAPGDKIKLGSFPAKKFPIKPFYIARYLITNLQFQAFLDDPVLGRMIVDKPSSLSNCHISQIRFSNSLGDSPGIGSP